jgi:hypothetical protein
MCDGSERRVPDAPPLSQQSIFHARVGASAAALDENAVEASVEVTKQMRSRPRAEAVTVTLSCWLLDGREVRCVPNSSQSSG